jgi:hypothetical protein
MSSALRIHVQPVLRDSALILAFEGWNDAGGAASSALRFVDEAIQSVPLADIDPEEYFDFTVRRPDIVFDGDGRRAIRWPSLEFRYGSIDAARELVTGSGDEPHLRWNSFCGRVAALCADLGLRRVVMLGAYLADVVYSRPVQVSGFATYSGELERIGVSSSGYQGSTGIVGVLSERLEREGADVVSLWAALPQYINLSPNPRGALALLQKLSQLLDIRVDDASLRKQAADFEEKISQLVANDSELAAYVKQLKRREFAQ